LYYKQNSTSVAVYGAGGGGGAGDNGEDAYMSTNKRIGYGGLGGAGITPSVNGINIIYTAQLCVGGKGGGLSTGTSSTTYGSGAGGGGNNDISGYRYGRPGAIIIAVPKT
jgi:hypothetical protein